MTRRAPIALIAIALAVQPVRADWQETFRQAIGQYDQRRWQRAAAGFRAAISENPVETGLKVRIAASRTEPYTPHYYLIYCLLMLKDCDEANRVQLAAEKQGALLAANRAALMKLRSGGLCRELAAPPPPPGSPPAGPPPSTGPTPAELAALKEAFTKAEEAINKADAARQSAEALGATSSAATDALQRARRELADARTKGDAKGAAAATGDANSAFTQFEAVRGEAEAKLKSPPTTFDPGTKPPTPDAPSRGTGSTPAGGAAPPTTPAGTKSAAGSEPGKSGSAAPPPNPPPPVEPPREPPDDLLEGVTLFRQGKYREASDKLARVRDDPQYQFETELLRAAATYSTYLVGGARDADLRGRAETFVRRCKSRKPGFKPDTQYFSPRFVDFYQSTPSRPGQSADKPGKTGKKTRG